MAYKLKFSDGSTIDILSGSYISSIYFTINSLADLDGLAKKLSNKELIKTIELTLGDETTKYEYMTLFDTTFKSIDVTPACIQVEIGFRQMSDLERMEESLEIVRENLPDEEALKVKDIFLKWEDLIGTVHKMGFRFISLNQLYKVVQPEITFDSHFIPGTPGTESLYVKVDETHVGSLEDPIPWQSNMIAEKDKYYVEGDLMALCVEDSINPLYNSLNELCPGRYFEIVSQK